MADHSVSPDEMVAPVSDGERLRRVAREDFGWEHLRPGQLETMTALLAGRDVLVGMPTGSGKSAIYQVTAALADSITVVVSPLIALQRDQVAGIVGADDAPSRWPSIPHSARCAPPAPGTTSCITARSTCSLHRNS